MTSTADVTLPKVSVICLCYNHARFVQNTLHSVRSQVYPNVEIIIVNDASTDNSAHMIKEVIEDQPEIQFLDLAENVGNCKAFNLGLSQSHGKYVIDLSCDDELMPDRIEKQVHAFEKLPENYGVLYSDAVYIDEAGNQLSDHFSRFVPARGDLYSDLVSRYFIAPPTMMIRKAVLDDLGGYDEQLAYEDFDFWVRSARNWKYDYLPEPLTRIRKTQGSLSSWFYERDSPLMASTLAVCEKIQAMNKTDEESAALARRLTYELKIAGLTGSRTTAHGFYRLLASITSPDWQSKWWLLFSRLHWNAYSIINKLRN